MRLVRFPASDKAGIPETTRKGRPVTVSPTTYEVFDPATLEVVGTAPLHTAEDMERAVALAGTAAAAWAADRGARRSALRSIAAAVRTQSGRLGEILSREQGKVLREAVMEFQVAAGLFDYYADLEWDQTEQLPERDGRRLSVDYRPVGLVGAITPWNFPISLLAVKLAPALVAGCTVIAKPSPSTPLSTIALVELMNGFLPPHVLTSVTGRGVLSRALSTLPGVRKISFTGSTEVGTAIMAQAAPTVKRVTLELGGNDPAIVLPDADPAFTAAGIIGSAFRNAGQVCMAVKRVFVPRSLAGELTEALAAAAAGLVVGRGLDAGTSMGPMHNAAQRDLVASLVTQAVNDGGKLAFGGGTGTSLPGYFMEPTIISDAPHNTPLVCSEQFGSALPVSVYDDVEDVLAQLNAQEFGLGASVWTPDLDRAGELAARIEAGTVWINQHTQVELDAPFGGWKASGMGRERGHWGLSEYLQTRTVNAMAGTHAVAAAGASSAAQSS
ncbi:aldehyde dehydrogenase family protein [Arthrobacter sp. Sa2CUA1]|uniref:Aldehyde dehydrogenase family protein n=1 Tax=Arthrobacter gallicola TaxID=2762225 RepID=A0ABR8UVQ9_9MICC|nr:aldehyde dehydrogenase family protein [Arthrobacter gallicola]